MAKKPRTPPPPRKVQAPKQRHAPRQGLDAARRRQLLWGAGGAALVVGAVVLIVVLGGGGSGSAGNPQAIAAIMKTAGCTLTTSKAASGQHIASLSPSAKVTYSTYPPASGRHYAIPAILNNYTQAVDPRQAVHNEEHGAVVIWVGPGVSAAERQQITDFYDESPNAMVVTPIANTTAAVTYPKHAPPGSKIYLTAWTVQIKNGEAVNGTSVVATCPRFDEKAFKAFRDELRGKGPERVPVSQLTPGT